MSNKRGDNKWESQPGSLLQQQKLARHSFQHEPRPATALTVLLYDVSSSMEGSKHRAAYEAALREVSSSEGSSTHFIVGAFSHDVFFPSRLPMDGQRAREAMRQLPLPSGGTALYRAVAEAGAIVEGILDDNPQQYDPRLTVVKVASTPFPASRIRCRLDVG